MMMFIDNIICYFMADVLNFEKTNQKALSASLNKSNKKFALKLYKDSNIVASKI